MKHYIIVADNERKLYHVATFWCLWGTDGTTAAGGNPDAPCFTVIFSFDDPDAARIKVEHLNGAK